MVKRWLVVLGALLVAGVTWAAVTATPVFVQTPQLAALEIISGTAQCTAAGQPFTCCTGSGTGWLYDDGSLHRRRADVGDGLHGRRERFEDHGPVHHIDGCHGTCCDVFGEQERGPRRRYRDNDEHNEAGLCERGTGDKLALIV